MSAPGLVVHTADVSWHLSDRACELFLHCELLGLGRDGEAPMLTLAQAAWERREERR